MLDRNREQRGSFDQDNDNEQTVRNVVMLTQSYHVVYQSRDGLEICPGVSKGKI